MIQLIVKPIRFPRNTIRMGWKNPHLVELSLEGKQVLESDEMELEDAASLAEKISRELNVAVIQEK